MREWAQDYFRVALDPSGGVAAGTVKPVPRTGIKSPMPVLLGPDGALYVGYSGDRHGLSDRELTHRTEGKGEEWRRGRDLNPRWVAPYRISSARPRPLGDLSAGGRRR